MTKPKKIIKLYYLIILSILTCLSVIIYLEIKPNDLKVIIFDIGQGDAILIQTPDKLNILIDGGPDNKVVYKLGEYLSFYDRTIDLMILTHPHADHVVGLSEVLKRYEVKKVLTTGVKYYSYDYLTWQNLIAKQNIKVEIVDHQGIMPLGNGVELEILYPTKSLLNQEVENINNASIVAKLNYKDFSIMLTGDYEDEESLIGRNLDLSSEVLKVGHHGSDTANALEFLKEIDSGIAVISCGQDNKFKHPHVQTVQNLQDLGFELFQTDQQGDFVYRLAK